MNNEQSEKQVFLHYLLPALQRIDADIYNVSLTVEGNIEYVEVYRRNNVGNVVLSQRINVTADSLRAMMCDIAKHI